MKTKIMFCSVVFLFFLFTGIALGGTEGTYNTFYGTDAGTNTTGDTQYDTFIGAGAGHNTTGYYNTFLGYMAGYTNTTGNYNTFLGYMAGSGNISGSYNTYIGRFAGQLNTTGGGNVFLGYQAGMNETGSNKLYIDNSGTNTPLIYGEFDTPKLTINGNFNVISPSGLNRFSDNLTNSTQKVVRITLNHYTNAEEPVYLLGGTSAAANTYAHFGGGSTLGNTVTQMDFWTAANTTTLTGSARLTIKSDGKVGIGTRTPANALQMAGGAYSNGSSWVSASSREYKNNIQSLKAKDAMETLQKLNPVTFSYKISPQENNVGFIAEDVPELLATKDRKGLSSMDIVAVLTKVVQEQQKVAEAHQKIISELSAEVQNLKRELQLQ